MSSGTVRTVRTRTHLDDSGARHDDPRRQRGRGRRRSRAGGAAGRRVAHARRAAARRDRARARAGRRRARSDRSAGRRHRPWRVHRPAHRPGGHPGPGDGAATSRWSASRRSMRWPNRSDRRADADVDRCPWMDAQRGDVFATLDRSAIRRDARTARPPPVREPLLESWRAHLAGRRAIFIGDAAARDAATDRRTPATAAGRRATPAPLAPQIARHRPSPRAAGRSRTAARAPADLRAAARRGDRARTPGPSRDRKASRVERRSSGSRRRRPRRRPGDRGSVVQQPDDARVVRRRAEAARGLLHLRAAHGRASRSPAFCAFWLVVDQAHINNLAVRPELRGRGLGTQLLDVDRRRGATSGCRELTLEVRRSNIAGAAACMPRRGFHAGRRAEELLHPARRRRAVLLRKIALDARETPLTICGRVRAHRGGGIPHRPRKGGGNDG